MRAHATSKEAIWLSRLVVEVGCLVATCIPCFNPRGRLALRLLGFFSSRTAGASNELPIPAERLKGARQIEKAVRGIGSTLIRWRRPIKEKDLLRLALLRVRKAPRSTSARCNFSSCVTTVFPWKTV